MDENGGEGMGRFHWSILPDGEIYRVARQELMRRWRRFSLIGRFTVVTRVNNRLASARHLLAAAVITPVIHYSRPVIIVIIIMA